MVTPWLLSNRRHSDLDFGDARRASAIVGIAALLTTSCASSPSREFVRATAQEFLDSNHVCALMPGHGRYGEALFVRDPQDIAAFVEAGLVKIVPAPSGKQAFTGSRTWFEPTDLGDALSERCLTNANAYPKEYSWGFRIGHREIVRTTGPGKPIKSRCFSIASVAVNWRLRVDAKWFDPARFGTNVSAYNFEPSTGEGLTLVPYAKIGKVWSQQDLADPHSNLACMEID